MNRSEFSTLNESRKRAIGRARNHVKRAQSEKRALTGEEQQTISRELARAEIIGSELAAESTAEYRSMPLDIYEGPLSEVSMPSRYAAFRKYLSAGVGALTQGEQRALQVDNDTAGGFMVMPVQTTVGVLTKLDDLLFVRAKGTVLPPVAANTRAIPVVDSEITDADWSAEIQTVSFDTGMTFGQRALTPHPLTKGLKVSTRLLRESEGRAESIVQNRLAYKLAVPQERAFMIGTGAAQPLGLFTASPQGISTARDITTGSTTTAVTGDSFVNARFNVKSQYQVNGEWVLSRTALLNAMLLKDTAGRFIWEAAENPGDPDMILGKRVNQSEYAPSTFTTGLYVGLFGDLSYYHIQDQLPEIQRLDERYAETNQTGFIARAYCDGMPTIEEAFSRMKLA